MKFFISLVWVLFLAPSIGGDSDHFIYWKAGHRLTWKDYRGPVPPHNPHIATTHYEIGFDMKFEENEPEFIVYCAFDPDLSWVKEGTESADLLEHEQLHFDIAELYARKLRRELSQYKFDMDNYESEIGAIFNLNQKECKRFQNKFDLETDHGIKVDLQRKWTNMVNKELEKYAKFASKGKP